MKKSGLADSPFFAMSREKQVTAPLPGTPQLEVRQGTSDSTERQAAEPAAARETTTPRNHDATVPRYHDTTIEAIRKIVKEFGKEAATHRFTAREKQAIAQIVYAYKGKGVRTSENQIARIAINWLIADFHENREHSVLELVLRALNG